MPLDANDERRLREVEYKVNELWQRSESNKYVSGVKQRIVLMGNDYTTATGAITNNTQALQLYGYYNYLTGVGARVSWFVPLGVGDYILTLVGVRGVSGSINTQLLIDSVLVSTFSMAATASSWNNIFTFPLTITVPRLHMIQLAVNDSDRTYFTAWYIDPV